MNSTTYKFVMKLIYIELVLVIVASISIVFLQNTAYWYDEIIVTSISKQPIPMLLQTIKFEPHPFGLYFLLKLVNVNSPVLARIFAVLISNLLLGLAIIWADRRGIIQKYKLHFGLLVWVTSAVWISIESNIKQDFITAPLLILFFFILLDYFSTKQINRILLLGVVSLIIMCFGYVNFATAFLIFLLTVLFDRRKKALLIAGIVSIFVATYLGIWGYQQFLNNSNRFTWQQYSEKSAVIGAYFSLAGKSNSSNVYGDLLFIVVFFSLAIFTQYPKAKYQKTILIVLLALVVTEVLLSVPARSRYLVSAHFLIIVAGGWGLEILFDKIKFKKEWFIALLGVLGFLNGIVFFFGKNNTVYNYHIKQKQELDKISLKKPTGILFRHPNETFIIKIGYFDKNEYVIPVSAFLKTAPTKIDTVTSEILSFEGKGSDINQEQIKQNLRNTNLTRFAYIIRDTTKWENDEWYYDPEYQSLGVLNKACPNKDFEYVNGMSIFVFDNCEF